MDPIQQVEEGFDVEGVDVAVAVHVAGVAGERVAGHHDRRITADAAEQPPTGPHRRFAGASGEHQTEGNEAGMRSHRGPQTGLG